MNSLLLKIIALIFMSIDHIGIVLLDNNIIFRFLGRIAFPLYGFLLVEGFNHTKNNKSRLIRYLFSLLILGFISEYIHDIVLFSNANYLMSQNILFTFSTCLLCMLIYEKNSSTLMDKVISIMIVILVAGLAEMLALEYGFFGILLIFSFYLISKIELKNVYKYIMYVIVITMYTILIYIYGGYLKSTFGIILCIIPIIMYNGTKGYNSKIIKYLFYIYYPVHLLLLSLLK